MVGLAGLGLTIFKDRLQQFSLLFFGLSMLLMGLGFMKESVGLLSNQLDIQMLSGYPLIVFLMVGIVLPS